ncbi:hemerythrin domain-containing protein, partial [Streptomyces sp. DH18]|nr:hemerythrin domain-containing protein [Streptomyces sp. DH18]
RRSTDSARLASMARGVKAAEAMAPTRPHPGVQSAGANMALGPLAALMDRTKDAVRKAMGKDG